MTATARVGQVITDGITGRTFTVTAHDGDTTCSNCGGLVRNWTRYTLVRPQGVTAADRYDQKPDSAHLFVTGLLGACPGQVTP